MVNLIYTVLCILCLCIGFFVGFNLQKDVKVLPKVENPIKKIKNKIAEKQEMDNIQEQIEQINTIYENIENYDGTGNNQKELKNIEVELL